MISSAFAAIKKKLGLRVQECAYETASERGWDKRAMGHIKVLSKAARSVYEIKITSKPSKGEPTAHILSHEANSSRAEELEHKCRGRKILT